jgi:hypothetical protein
MIVTLDGGLMEIAGLSMRIKFFAVGFAVAIGVILILRRVNGTAFILNEIARRKLG